MDSPFQTISEAFQAKYNVNFCVKSPDGGILITLSDNTGIALRHFIEADQWRDSRRLQDCIAAVKGELAANSLRQLGRTVAPPGGPGGWREPQATAVPAPRPAP
ncbi:DUF3509 domain-containing protein [Azorhizophilus paspali]|uniref:DUF3509 domain-containing protein n=1 Tax=Azorhizophilus paspali TaxID=69963 RepID=A0ABV6SPE3_AZOPA